jgi:hypothetical protein
LFRPSDIAKLGKKKPMEEESSIGVKYLKVLRKVLLFQSISLKVFGRFSASFESFLKVFKAPLPYIGLSRNSRGNAFR